MGTEAVHYGELLRREISLAGADECIGVVVPGRNQAAGDAADLGWRQRHSEMMGDRGSGRDPVTCRLVGGALARCLSRRGAGSLTRPRTARSGHTTGLSSGLWIGNGSSISSMSRSATRT